MNEKNLCDYYNKFNEDKRLNRRHGIVEFTIVKKYIDKYLKDNCKIIDIGAGTGKYSSYINSLGYDITAVELVKSNLVKLKENVPNIKAYQGNALDLSKFKDESFDIVLLFGPLYHLISKEEKIKALEEAKRIVKQNGIIMIQYCLKDFAIIKHGFIDENISESINNNTIDSNFNIISKEEDLYSFVTIDEIDELNSLLNLKSITRVNPDGLTEYMRPSINKLSDEDFNTYINYVLKNCEDKYMLGYGRHLLDIVTK